MAKQVLGGVLIQGVKKQILPLERRPRTSQGRGTRVGGRGEN